MTPKMNPGEPPSGRPLTDVDEVAGRLVLTRIVGLEVSVDCVLHVVVEGLPQQLAEVLQAVRIVGQTEITDFWKVLQGRLRHLDGVVQGDHMRFTVDPQNRGGDVLS